MSGKIIFTLLKKDLKGCLTNKNILVSFLIPIVFCFIYQNVFKDLGDEMGDYVLGMCAVFSIAISPTSILPVMIAEEKEKYTLRSLMMARVRGQEFLASKMIVCLLMTALDAAAVFFITGGDVKNFPVYTGAVLLASAGLCFLGALAGLLARDQASAGTIGAPLMLLTMLPPLFGEGVHRCAHHLISDNLQWRDSKPGAVHKGQSRRPGGVRPVDRGWVHPVQPLLSEKGH